MAMSTAAFSKPCVGSILARNGALTSLFRGIPAALKSGYTSQMAKDSDKRVLQIELIVPEDQAGESLSKLRGKIAELGLKNSSLVEVTEADGEDRPRYKITSTRLQ
jgi:hypothetical protein